MKLKVSVRERQPSVSLEKTLEGMKEKLLPVLRSYFNARFSLGFFLSSHSYTALCSP